MDKTLEYFGKLDVLVSFFNRIYSKAKCNDVSKTWTFSNPALNLLIPQVNNAGSGRPTTVSDSTIDYLEESIDVHVKGPFNITQRALPAITKGKGLNFTIWNFGI